MATKKKAAPRKRSAKLKPPAEPLVEVSEPEPVEGQGPVVSLPFEPTEKTPPPELDVPADGMLIRRDGAPVVYVMDKGRRRPFANADVLEDCVRLHLTAEGASWNEVVVLSHEEIDRIPQGPEVTGPADLQ